MQEWQTRGSAVRKAVQQSCLRGGQRPSAMPSRPSVRKSRHQVYRSRRSRETQRVKKHGERVGRLAVARDKRIVHGRDMMLIGLGG